MRRASQLLWWFMVGGGVMPQFAQSADSGAMTVDQQRQRIAASRIEKTAEFDAQDALCASRFAVNDCRQVVANHRRELLRDLRQQENKLNDMERESRGAAQRQRLQEKDRGGAGVATPLTHRPDQDAPVAPVPQRPTSMPPTARTTSVPLAPDIVEKNRAAFEDKQRAAQVRQQARDKRLQEKREGATALPKAP